MPTDLDVLGGSSDILSAKCQCELKTGDVFLAVPHGGGGFGDPLQRPAKLVMADVVAGTVSRQAAREQYGVVLDDRKQLDPNRTMELRDCLRLQRVRTKALVQRSDARTELDFCDNDARPYGALIVRMGVARCGACGEQVGRDVASAYHALIARKVELHTLGPRIAKRWQGKSPFVEAVQLACPHCGHAVWTEQVLKDRPSHFNDYVLSDET
jgi:N-methylhydantoinase B